MAPPNGSAKARKAGNGGGKPVKATKPVVPAIPLPFVKRRAAAEAAAAAAAAASSTPAKQEDDAAAKPAPVASRTEPEVTNGVASTDQKDTTTPSSLVEKVDSQPKETELLDAVSKSNTQSSPGMYTCPIPLFCSFSQT